MTGRIETSKKISMPCSMCCQAKRQKNLTQLATTRITPRPRRSFCSTDLTGGCPDWSMDLRAHHWCQSPVQSRRRHRRRPREPWHLIKTTDQNVKMINQIHSGFLAFRSICWLVGTLLVLPPTLERKLWVSRRLKASSDVFSPASNPLNQRHSGDEFLAETRNQVNTYRHRPVWHLFFGSQVVCSSW